MVFKLFKKPRLSFDSDLLYKYFRFKKIVLLFDIIYKRILIVKCMKQMLSALPVQCKRCGEVFDLSYDLEDVSQERLLQELIRTKRNPARLLCWECRTAVVRIG